MPTQDAEEVARLRTLVRAFRPRSGSVEVRLLHPATEEWVEYSAGEKVAEAIGEDVREEIGPDFWLADDRDEIPAAPPRQVEVAAQALGVTLRDACREGEPGPRDLEAAGRRLGRSAWALIDWGDYRSAHGDLDEAARLYRAAGDLEPWNAFPWLHLARAARATKGGAGIEAEALRAVLNRVPRHEESRERLARLRSRAGGRGGAGRRHDSRRLPT
jgi:hypothetical protein